MQYLIDALRDQFNAAGFAFLVAALLATGIWLLIFAARWFASQPRLPDAAPDTNELGPESPAVANLLVNRCGVTHSAIAATLLDLAARDALAIDQLSEEDFVVRLRTADRIKGPLTPYEQQVLALVKERAKGGSCPVPALELRDRGQWWKRFQKSVVQDARDRGLVRNRWSRHDWAILATGLAIVLCLYALALGIAGIGDSGQGNDDDIGLLEWLGIAAVGWIGGLAGIDRLKSIRETPAGSAATAHWLGVRNYFRHAHTFDDLPPAAVILWERNLAYAAALGVAHEAVRRLPFEEETPESAWSRYSGDWHEVRIRYPERFGACREPWKVLLDGAWRIVVWGALAFFVLPIALDVALEFIDELQAESTISDRATFTIAATAVGIVTVMGMLFTLRFLGGVIRFYRAFRDFGEPLVIEGEVVKLHAGRVAVFDGEDDDVVAWRPPLNAPALRRGQLVRVTITPNLHWVRSIEPLPARAARREAATAH